MDFERILVSENIRVGIKKETFHSGMPLVF